MGFSKSRLSFAHRRQTRLSFDRLSLNFRKGASPLLPVPQHKLRPSFLRSRPPIVGDLVDTSRSPMFGSVRDSCATWLLFSFHELSARYFFASMDDCFQGGKGGVERESTGVGTKCANVPSWVTNVRNAGEARRDPEKVSKRWRGGGFGGGGVRRAKSGETRPNTHERPAGSTRHTYLDGVSKAPLLL